MEERKIKEIEYYDKKARIFSAGGDFEGFQPQTLASFRFLYKLLEKHCPGKQVLDYGCGNGIHSTFLIRAGAKKVIGIDLSAGSLERARAKAKREGVGQRIEFLKMDCERMEFPDNSFDLILDGGTFSSLDLKRAYLELVRVLKPEGLLIGIETFGHNPFTNLKRRFNKLTGKRTGWATEHIFQTKDLVLAQRYFNSVKVYYFHLVSWLAFPFLQFPGGKLFLKITEIIDRILLKVPFLRRYAFKVVFIFQNPKK